jgi:hypothetical protein
MERALAIHSTAVPCGHRVALFPDQPSAATPANCGFVREITTCDDVTWLSEGLSKEPNPRVHRQIPHDARAA